MNDTSPRGLADYEALHAIIQEWTYAFPISKHSMPSWTRPRSRRASCVPSRIAPPRSTFSQTR